MKQTKPRLVSAARVLTLQVIVLYDKNIRNNMCTARAHAIYQLTMITCGKYKGRRFADVALCDRSYCAWVLRGGGPGFNAVAAYLRDKHGGAVTFGKHKGLFFDEVFSRRSVREAKKREGMLQINLEHMRACTSVTENALAKARKDLSELQKKFDSYKGEAERNVKRLKTRISTLAEGYALDRSRRDMEVRTNAITSIQQKVGKQMRTMKRAYDDMFKHDCDENCVDDQVSEESETQDEEWFSLHEVKPTPKHDK